MNRRTFTIPLKPVPKGRPRFRKYPDGTMRTYTPEETRQFEGAFIVLSREFRPPTPWEGPIHIALTFVLPKPKVAKRDFPIMKFDIDNLCKSVFDSMNKIFWKDDAQVVSLVASKIYGEPSITVDVQELEETQ